MRPLRLELEGFTTFRQPVTVDLEGADLFALSGPTGAGKSSLLDAVCFALFGTVPRLDRRAVAPVVAAGLTEARVRLDFAVGERTYTAARVVRRTSSGGATTKEARLERGEETLAGDADAVTRAVEEVLGLGFEQFTTCVLLPQGEFARFLHDRPADRQALLVRLLDLAVYDRMREAAKLRRAAAEAGQLAAERELASLEGATPEALAEADARSGRLAALREELDAASPRLDALLAAEREADRERAAAQDAADRLGCLAPPEELDALAAGSAQAAAEAAAADAAAREAEEAVRRAETARAALGDAAALERARAAARERVEVAARIDRGAPIVAAALREEAAAAAAAQRALQALDAAEDALASAQREHAAAELAAGLAPGEDCPVCRRPLEALPAHAAGEELAGARAARDRARREAEERRAALARQAERRAVAETTLAGLTERRDELDAALAGAPDPAEVERLLAAVSAADAALTAARAAERDARDRVRAAADAAAAQRRREAQAWTAFDAARDALAALGPPPAERADLGAAWAALTRWAGGRAPALRTAAEAAEAAARAAAAEHAALHAALVARCGALGVDTAGGRRLRDACADALAEARARRERVAADLERAARLRAALAAETERGAVARTLARHLAANGFERWLLDEALARLAAGASETLRELSAGQYSLAVDDARNFLVVDHRSADERRPARTLSGGETFLASLALALTLADHLAELATGSTARLESIFLDEGFGTLDPDSLDVVAVALEELGARGRMVAVVTHVRDLAERLPVRFEVRKGPKGSTVERVVA